MSLRWLSLLKKKKKKNIYIYIYIIMREKVTGFLNTET